MDTKPKPMYRRHDSKSEVYRRATVPEMHAVRRGNSLPPPQEPLPILPLREE
jgi:hypothetical protein